MLLLCQSVRQLPAEDSATFLLIAFTSLRCDVEAMQATTDSHTAIDILTQVAEHVATAWGTDQALTLAELKELIAGLRATSKDARDLCNLLVQGVQLELPNTEEATKQRVLGLKHFTKLKTLELAAGEDDLANGQPRRPNTQQLTAFVGFWLCYGQAHLLSLTLRHCKLTVGAVALITAAMPHLKNITFEYCEAESQHSLEPLASCSQLHSACIRQTGDDPLDNMSKWAGLACVSSLRSLVINLEQYVEGVTLDCAGLIGMTQLTKLELQLNRADVINERYLSHLTNLEELVLDCVLLGDNHSSFDELAYALSALHIIKKLWLDTLSRECWVALRNTCVEELRCFTLAIFAEDLPMPVIPTLQKVIVMSFEEAFFPATAMVGLLGAVPASAVVHLEHGAAWHEKESMPELQQAMQLAEHLQSVMQAMDTGRLTGERFQPNFLLRGWIPPGSWPPMRHVDTVIISGMEEAVVSNWSGTHFAAVFPDVRHLWLSSCRWDVRRFLQGLQDMARLESVWVNNCDGLPDSRNDSVQLLREDLTQFNDLAGL